MPGPAADRGSHPSHQFRDVLLRIEVLDQIDGRGVECDRVRPHLHRLDEIVTELVVFFAPVLAEFVPNIAAQLQEFLTALVDKILQIYYGYGLVGA